jgi:hypothetical protein
VLQGSPGKQQIKAIPAKTQKGLWRPDGHTWSRHGAEADENVESVLLPEVAVRSRLDPHRYRVPRSPIRRCGAPGTCTAPTAADPVSVLQPNAFPIVCWRTRLSLLFIYGLIEGVACWEAGLLQVPCLPKESAAPVGTSSSADKAADLSASTPLHHSLPPNTTVSPSSPFHPLPCYGQPVCRPSNQPPPTASARPPALVPPWKECAVPPAGADILLRHC